jgi:hypothetical protein
MTVRCARGRPMSGDPQDREHRVVLPARSNVRWTARRKRAVLLALDLGEIGQEEIYRRYAIHPDELSAWRRGEVFTLPAKLRRRPDRVSDGTENGLLPEPSKGRRRRKAHHAMKAKLFEDRVKPGAWRVERDAEDAETEVAIFSGPDARERAILYAGRLYGDFEEVGLAAQLIAPGQEGNYCAQSGH